METKNLILLRGVPGSGKTTFGHLIADTNYDVLSADDYFVNSQTGEYEFDGSQLKEAHINCQIRAEARMSRGDRKVIVANTFTREWEMKAYYDLAERYGYRVYSIIVENRHGGVNEYGAPEEAIKRMRDRFEIKL